MAESMLKDKRRIKQVFCDLIGGWIYNHMALPFNTLPVSDIVVYEEVGQMAYVPWIAVYSEGKIVYRFPASSAFIEYYEEGK